MFCHSHPQSGSLEPDRAPALPGGGEGGEARTRRESPFRQVGRSPCHPARLRAVTAARIVGRNFPDARGGADRRRDGASGVGGGRVLRAQMRGLRRGRRRFGSRADSVRVRAEPGDGRKEADPRERRRTRLQRRVKEGGGGLAPGDGRVETRQAYLRGVPRRRGLLGRGHAGVGRNPRAMRPVGRRRAGVGDGAEFGKAGPELPGGRNGG